jgi:hypothetical protein
MKVEIQVYHNGRVYAQGVDTKDFVDNRSMFFAAYEKMLTETDSTMMKLLYNEAIGD